MAKKKKSKQQKQTNQDESLKAQVDFISEDNRDSSQKNQDELLIIQTDLTSKDVWEEFYKRKEIADKLCEWYADWPELQTLLTENLLCESSLLEKPLMERIFYDYKSSEEVRILVPGCGNSKMSEHLYDLGFLNVTNVDFSKVVILDMMNRNLRERPAMKWRVMDMTDLKFPNESFDAVVDKGGLDIVMSSKIRPRLGYLYLSAVKRVLTAGGKFICLTLAEPHVLDLLLHKFRFGWKMSLHMLDREPYNTKPKLPIFVVVVEKDCPTSVFEISSFLDEYSVESHGDQASDFHEALEKERKIRVEVLNNNDVLYSLEDLRLGAQGDIKVVVPGRRLKLILGEAGVSSFSYYGILLDSKNESEDLVFPYAVILVPEEKSQSSPYSSERGQWKISVQSKFARLLMVLMDTCNSIFSMEDAQEDIYPLAKQLTPANYVSTCEIPFVFVSSLIEQREIVYQATSDLTGPIVVDDVMYEGQVEDYEDVKSRRLIFKRAENLVQSEAVISTKPSPCREVEIDRDHLSSLYHHGVYSAIIMLSSHFVETIPHGSPRKALVIGLGGGMLPMYFRKNIPYFKIEVVELDPVVVDIAREYFGFQEDEQLKVHIGDGIKFVKEIADSEPEAKSCLKLDIVIVDVDSTEFSDGMSCPGGSFVEGAFLLAARESLAEHGVLFMNLVSRSSCLKQGVYSMMKKVFTNVFRMKIDGDANEIVVGVKTERRVLKEEFSQSRQALLLDSPWNQSVVEFIRGMEQLS